MTEAAGTSTSLTAYVKRALEEYLNVKVEISERQTFHGQILAAVREEMQEQGMKLIFGLLHDGSLNMELYYSLCWLWHGDSFIARPGGYEDRLEEDMAKDITERVRKGIMVNFFGTLISDVPLPLVNDNVLWLYEGDFVWL